MPEPVRPTSPLRPRRIGTTATALALAALALAVAPAFADPAPAGRDAGLATAAADGAAAARGLDFGLAGSRAIPVSAGLASGEPGPTGLAAVDGRTIPAEAGEPAPAAEDDPAASPPETDAGAPPIDKASDRVLRIGTAEELIDVFEAIGFSYVEARDYGEPVPRLQVASFPRDLDELNTLFLRKSAFFNTLLPIVLQVNEEILADRARLLALRARLRDGGPIRRGEDRWLSDLAERYEVDDRDLDDLAIRVDAIPPSMALAMAAVESGWGTSSLARRANALFGQITAPGAGLETESGYTYATFATLRDSVAAYARNLNTHGAYREFRALRTAMRRAGDVPDGYRLMGELEHYSELGNRYIAYIRRVIRDDELHRFDDALLVPAAEVNRPS
jgi:Bax protein